MSECTKPSGPTHAPGPGNRRPSSDSSHGASQRARSAGPARCRSSTPQTPTTRIRGFPSNTGETTEYAGAHLGYDETDPQPAPHRWRVGRPTPERSSFRSEMSRCRLFARAVREPCRTYQISKSCQNVHGRKFGACLQLHQETAESAPNHATAAVTGADNVVRSRGLWVTQK
jgi:hypothetical protein